MVNDNSGELKLTITQDKLVDILMHAATREDIAKLDAKIDNLESKIEAKINNLESRMETKIGALEAKIGALDTKFDAKYDKIIWGIVIAILVPIAIQIISHFIK